ncbi:Mitochondrial distribution and morphology protein 12 [Mortierella alpina]|nr:Mitochondrial distribution and morphology protein 12 [Mortierella alpina]
MSFVFSWDKLDDEVALQIEGMIHAHFQRIPKPAFMGNIAVSKFRFGSTPPSITVLDVTDPLEEWYVHMEQEEARLAQEAAEAGGGESLDEDELGTDEDEYDDHYPYSADESIVMVGEGDDIEYLESVAYEEEERDRMEPEDWLRQNHRERAKSAAGSSSGDSYKGGVPSSRHGDQAAYSSRRAYSRNEESGSEQDTGAHPRTAQHPLKSRRSTLSRTSPSSTASSVSSEKSYGPGHQSRASTTTKRMNPNLKLDIETSLPASTQFPPARKMGTSHSLSSHASDEEIESEAFYTHGESTIYQRMKNMSLDPTRPLPPQPASIEGDSLEDPSHYHHGQHHRNGSSSFPTTPGSGANHGNNNNGGLGLGFGAGMGASPGSVLSTVMQNRSSTRPLSASSFYSAPPSASVTSPTGRSGQQPPQLYFPDLSGMVLSGNSLLGLRAGTPSRTIPSTPKGFESPTLAFSRRQSFSDTGDDSTQRAPFATVPADRASMSSSGVHDRDKEPPHTYVSPVEALNFDAFSQRPKVIDRLDEASSTGRGTRSDLPSHSVQGDQRNRSSSSYHRAQGHHSQRQEKNAERRTRKQLGSERYRRTSEASAPMFVSPAPSKRNENDIQLLLSVNYQGQMGFTVETEMLLNYPTFAFLALPVKLVITGFSFKAKVLMGYLRDHVNVCFLEPEDPSESILSNVRIESQVGDEQKHAVLKNVGKIERFVVEQLRKFITEDFVYPSYHSIELQRAPPPPAADSPAQLPRAGGLSGGSMASHADTFNPSRSTTTASMATNNTSVRSGVNSHRSATEGSRRESVGSGRGRGLSAVSRGSYESAATGAGPSLHSRGADAFGGPSSLRARSSTASSVASSYPHHWQEK